LCRLHELVILCIWTEPGRRSRVRSKCERGIVCPSRVASTRRPSLALLGTANRRVVSVPCEVHWTSHGRTSGFSSLPPHQTKTPPQGWEEALRAGMCRSRLMAIQPSFAACCSGPPVRLCAPASNLMSTGHQVVEPAGSHLRRLHQTKTPPQGWRFCLVEAAGIEPASASPTQAVLHA
jgi:hypothetical protein